MSHVGLLDAFAVANRATRAGETADELADAGIVVSMEISRGDPCATMRPFSVKTTVSLISSAKRISCVTRMLVTCRHGSGRGSPQHLANGFRVKR